MLGKTLCFNSVITITLGNRCQNLQSINNTVTERIRSLKKLMITPTCVVCSEKIDSVVKCKDNCFVPTVQTITIGNRCQNLQMTKNIVSERE